MLLLHGTCDCRWRLAAAKDIQKTSEGWVIVGDAGALPPVGVDVSSSLYIIMMKMAATTFTFLLIANQRTSEENVVGTTSFTSRDGG